MIHTGYIFYFKLHVYRLQMEHCCQFRAVVLFLYNSKNEYLFCKWPEVEHADVISLDLFTLWFWPTSMHVVCVESFQSCLDRYRPVICKPTLWVADRLYSSTILENRLFMRCNMILDSDNEMDIFMVTIWDSADHYIFILSFVLLILLFFLA